MKTVGIIGGFGPEGTAKFYLEIIARCHTKNKTQRPPILIWNVPLEYKIENELIKHAKGEKRYLSYLLEAARVLEKGGADFLVMPCNTLHTFIKNIRNATSKPVLSIIDETAKTLKGKGVKKIGILATQSTLDKNLYTKVLQKQHIITRAPAHILQKKLDRVIYNILHNTQTSKDIKTVGEILEHFTQQNIRDVVLACTDLQLLSPKHPKIEIHDTMEILANATATEILK